MSADSSRGACSSVYALPSGLPPLQSWVTAGAASLRWLVAVWLLCGLGNLPAAQAQNVSALTLSPATTVGGQNVSATITLDGPAPAGGLTVHLTTSNVQFVALAPSATINPIQMLPADVAIPAGNSSLTLQLATAWANYTQSATLTATVGQQSADATLTLLGTNLRVSDILSASSLRLKWDGIATTSTYTLKRDGATIATLPAGTNSYDDVFASGFATGQSYLYQIFDSNHLSTNFQPYTQLSSTKFAPYLVTATSNQAVDSRLDLRYSDVHYVDHCFGATTYRGGLFAGFASDPARIGRSFARFLLPPRPEGGHFLRIGNIQAYCTGLHAPSGASALIGCQPLAEPNWAYSTLTWTQTNPAAFAPGAAPFFASIASTTDNPLPQWITWELPDVVKGAVNTSTAAPLTVGWAAQNEAQSGWAYFAKREMDAGLGPRAAYAYDVPVPIAAYRIPTTSNQSYYNIIMNGLNPGETVTVTLTGNYGGTAVVISGLNHVVGPLADLFTEPGTSEGYIWASVNGVTVPIQLVAASGGSGGDGGTGTGNPVGNPVFGGGG